MIFLANTTDTLQLVTSAAGTLDVQCNFVEAVKSGGAVSDLNNQQTAITTATTTTVLAAPGASNCRTLKQMTVRNKSATTPTDVTVLFNANATTYEIYKCTLDTGATCEYLDGVGFYTLAATAKLDKVLRVVNTVSNNTLSFADITGLTQALKSGKTYAIEACLQCTAAATTTGAQFGYNIGAAPTVVQFSLITLTTHSVTLPVYSSGQGTAVDTAFAATPTSSVTAAPTWIVGYIQPSADGTFALRFVSEVNASAINVLAGSWMTVRETDN